MEPVFCSAKHGYSMDEVDQYIDWLLGEFEKSQETCAALNERVATLESGSINQGELSQVMLSAHKFAQQVEKEAQDKAHTLLSHAENKADQLLRDAHAKVQQEVSSAKTQIEQMLGKSAEVNASVQKKLRDIYELLLPVMEKRSVSDAPSADLYEEDRSQSFSFNEVYPLVANAG